MYLEYFLEVHSWMEQGDYKATVKITAYEIWRLKGGPEVKRGWFADFLQESVTNYLVAIIVTLEILKEVWGSQHFESENLEAVVDHITEAMLEWAT